MDPVPVDEFQKFDSSIRRILKQVHPDAGLTGESYSIINKITNYIIKSLSIDEDITIEQLNNIIDELFTGGIHGLAHHAKNKGSKANDHNLQISIIQVKKAMELIGITPKSNESILYISGVCEYIISEIVELAGNCARDDKKVIIKPKHILIAIITDDELDEIFYKMIRKLVSQRDWLK